MNDKEMTERKRVFDALAADGWEVRDRDMLLFANKPYETEVGTKVASVRLTRIGNDQLSLTADYQSEGTNILEPVFVKLPVDLSDEKGIAESAKAFFGEVNSRVDASYARRLWLRSQADPEQDSGPSP